MGNPRSPRRFAAVLVTVVLVVAVGVASGWLLVRDRGSATSGTLPPARSAEPAVVTGPQPQAFGGRYAEQAGVALVTADPAGGVVVSVRSVEKVRIGLLLLRAKLPTWSLTQGSFLAGDFDGDGDSDLANVRQSSGGVLFEVSLAGETGFAAPVRWGLQRCGRWTA